MELVCRRATVVLSTPVVLLRRLVTATSSVPTSWPRTSQWPPLSRWPFGRPRFCCPEAFSSGDDPASAYHSTTPNSSRYSLTFVCSCCSTKQFSHGKSIREFAAVFSIPTCRFSLFQSRCHLSTIYSAAEQVIVDESVSLSFSERSDGRFVNWTVIGSVRRFHLH